MLTLTRGLEAARTDARDDAQGRTRYNSRELEGLPAPVQRYFRAALKEGQPIIAAASIELAGTFNMSATGEQWKPFISQQRVVTRRPGFLWNAQISMLPGLNVRVVDSYIAGQGLLHAAILGLFTMANLGGRGEIARGEFMRFFAEAAWYPTALLPSQGVRWKRATTASTWAGSVSSRSNQRNWLSAFRGSASSTGLHGIRLAWRSESNSDNSDNSDNSLR
jgi:hypothetical protein